MKKGRFNEEQLIGVLKQHEAGRKVADLARDLGVSFIGIAIGSLLGTFLGKR